MLWSAHRGALSIRAEYMRNGFGDRQSWRFRIDEMRVLDSVTSQATSNMLGYQCSQVKQSPNKRLTSQVFIYQQLQRPLLLARMYSSRHFMVTSLTIHTPSQRDSCCHIAFQGIAARFQTQLSYGVRGWDGVAHRPSPLCLRI